MTDKRGQTKPKAEMTELEKLRAENRLLKARTNGRKWNGVLKKLDEIERRRF